MLPSTSSRSPRTLRASPLGRASGQHVGFKEGEERGSSIRSRSAKPVRPVPISTSNGAASAEPAQTLGPLSPASRLLLLIPPESNIDPDLPDPDAEPEPDPHVDPDSELCSLSGSPEPVKHVTSVRANPSLSMFPTVDHNSVHVDLKSPNNTPTLPAIKTQMPKVSNGRVLPKDNNSINNGSSNIPAHSPSMKSPRWWQRPQIGLRGRWAKHKDVPEDEPMREAASKYTTPMIIRYLFRPCYIIFMLLSPFYFWALIQAYDNAFVSTLFLLSELLSFLLNIFFFFNFWGSTRREFRTLRSLRPRFDERGWPVVDMMICHYLEPVDVVKGPLQKCLALDYPASKLRVKILDDGYLGKRKDGRYSVSTLGQEMEEMVSGLMKGCKSYRMKVPGHMLPRRHAAPGGVLIVTYVDDSGKLPAVSIIARMKGRESHFKTGNLENAIYNAGTTADFLGFLDADMEPEPTFLQYTLPVFYTYDKKELRWRPNWEVAFVQTPQTFTNIAESNGEDDPLYQSNGLFFASMQPGRDGLGLASFAGTNALFFRPALDDSLGFIYGCLTEDAATGNKLHAFGWQGSYLNLNLCSGLCRESAGETMEERKRWVCGSVQMLLLALDWRIFKKRFLEPPLRLQYKRRLQDYHRQDIAGETQPLHQDDIGYWTRAQRRQSFFIWFARLMVFCDMTLYPLGSIVAFNIFILAMFYLIAGISPVQFFVQGEGWTKGSILVASMVLYQSFRFIGMMLACYILFLDGTAAVDLWRAMQGWFGFAWITFLGTIEAVLTAVGGKAMAWGTHVEGIFPSLELPNLFMCVSIWCGMGVALASLWVPILGPARGAFSVGGSLGLGMFVLLNTWPAARCTLAAILNLPVWGLRTPAFAILAVIIVGGVPAVTIVGKAGQGDLRFGSFYTGKYQNYFATLGYSTLEVQTNMNSSYQQVFYGVGGRVPVYTQTPDYMGWVKDGSADVVRSDVMALAMMVTLQYNVKPDFDKIWNFVRLRMQYQPPSLLAGLCAGEVTVDGQLVDPDPDTFAAQYMAMSLIFAAQRWQFEGPDASGDYYLEGQNILQAMIGKETGGSWNASTGIVNMINKTTLDVYLTNVDGGTVLTRPSVHMPAFYEILAQTMSHRYGGGKKAFWHQLAVKSRQYMEAVANAKTGLFPEATLHDGTPVGEGTGEAYFGKHAWMAGHQLALDWAWFEPKEIFRSDAYRKRLFNFFNAQGQQHYLPFYSLSGSPLPSNGTVDRFGLVGMNAFLPRLTTRLAKKVTGKEGLGYIQTLWDTEVPQGEFPAYDAMLYLMGVLHASGEYQVHDPTG